MGALILYENRIFSFRVLQKEIAIFNNLLGMLKVENVFLAISNSDEKIAFRKILTLQIKKS